MSLSQDVSSQFREYMGTLRSILTIFPSTDMWVVEKGIIKGISSTLFPNKICNRYQSVTFLRHAFVNESAKNNDGSIFTNTTPS